MRTLHIYPRMIFLASSGIVQLYQYDIVTFSVYPLCFFDLVMLIDVVATGAMYIDTFFHPPLSAQGHASLLKFVGRSTSTPPQGSRFQHLALCQRTTMDTLDALPVEQLASALKSRVESSLHNGQYVRPTGSTSCYHYEFALTTET